MPQRPLSHFAALLLACTVAALHAQSAAPAPAQPNAATPPAQATGAAPQPAATPAKNAKLPTTAERRRAAKLYMEAAALYENQQFEKALDLDQKAAALDPTVADYTLAIEVARSHYVTALIQEATRDQIKGDAAAARVALARALALDPGNRTVIDHVRALADAAVRSEPQEDTLLKTPALAPPMQIFPRAETHSFHLHTTASQVIQQVFSAYGIDATVDTSVRDQRGPNQRLRFDIDDASFAEATRALGMACNTFYVPIDVHRVLVARNTVANQMQYARNAVDTVYLSGLATNDMTEMGNIARNVFELRQINVDASAGTLTLRGPVDTLNAFNATYRDLLEGRSQVLLDVRLIQLAHTSGRTTGIQPPQTITAYNVYSEARSILNQNADLVQQIIAAGLAAPGDTLTILAILIASGKVSSALFSNGFLVFGGGLTQTALVPNSGLTLHLNLNSSDSRALDDYRIRLEDGEEGMLKSGTRYPIMTSSFSNVGLSGNIPGISGAGSSTALGGLLSSANLGSTNIPQFQYEDLGLVFKARPRVLRSGDVAMPLDLKISALAGTAINNVPVLANRSYTGVVTVPANQAVVLAAELNKTETRAISGYPGLSEVPGLNNIGSKDAEKNTSTLLIIIMPQVVRSSHAAGLTPMQRVDHAPGNR